MTIDISGAPAWARRYRATGYPAFAYAADLIALALSGRGDGLEVMVEERGEGGPFPGERALPGRFVDQGADRDAEAAARRELEAALGVSEPSYVEALRVYDENGRDPRQYAFQLDDGGGVELVGVRVVSSAFVALLVGDEPATGAADMGRRARPSDAYAYLPWEDLRSREGRAIREAMVEELRRWAGRRSDRLSRIGWAWGWVVDEWNEERARDRLELLMAAGLVEEARRDRWGVVHAGAPSLEAGRAMAFDHRLMLADGIGRLRGKCKYVPAVLAALMRELFTVSQLQAGVEAVLGRPLVRQNFRRTLEEVHELLEATEFTAKAEGAGRPPRLYRFREGAALMRLDPSIRMPFVALELEP